MIFFVILTQVNVVYYMHVPPVVHAQVKQVEVI